VVKSGQKVVKSEQIRKICSLCRISVGKKNCVLQLVGTAHCVLLNPQMAPTKPCLSLRAPRQTPKAALNRAPSGQKTSKMSSRCGEYMREWGPTSAGIICGKKVPRQREKMCGNGVPRQRGKYAGTGSHVSGNKCGKGGPSQREKYAGRKPYVSIYT
jgi:hypothetical protein